MPINPENGGMENPKPVEKKKIVIVEASDAVEQEARDAAEAKLTAEKKDLKGFKGFFSKIWKHNLFYDYYRQKEIAQVRKQILAGEKNIYAGEKATQKAHDDAMEAITERFVSDYDDAIHKEAGEKKEILEDTTEEKEIKNNIKSLVERYARSEVDKENFTEEKNRIFSQVKGVKKDVIDKGVLYADNLLEVAKQIKESVDNGERLSELDIDFEVIVGKAKTGVRTEAQYNAVDKITNAIMNNKVGKFFNETTVASAVSIAYCLSKGLAQRIASSRVAAIASFGGTAAVSSIIAGAREGRRVEDERRQHFREMAKGKTFDEAKAPRRKEMEEYRYQTKDVRNLIDNLENVLYEYDQNDNKEVKKLNKDQVLQALNELAEIESRIKLSDRNKIDLISYSDTTKVEQERLDLDLARAQAKIDLKKIIGSNNDFESILGNDNFNDYLNNLSETKIQELISSDQGIERKNALFKKMKNKKVTGAVVKGLITGLTIGAIAQEVGAYVRDDQQGFVETLIKGKEHFHAGTINLTPMEYLKRLMTNDLPKNPTTNIFTETIVGKNHVNLPEGFDLGHNKDGTYNILSDGKPLLDNFKLNPDGTLPAETKKLLEGSGFGTLEYANKFTETHHENILVGAKEYAAHHLDKLHKIARRLWYDNDTEAPIFDKNELKLWWGGHDNSGINSKGDYVFNIENMTKEGSYHTPFSVDAQAAMKAGQLKMLFSISEDTQKKVFEVPIDTNGNAIIDPKSVLGKMLFANENGHALFKGRFAEVAQSMGMKNGEEQVRILATHEGNGLKTVGDIITKTVTKETPVTTINIPTDYKVEPPHFIPMFGRTPMEPTKRKTDYVSGYFQSEKRNAHEFRERRSPRLNNPETMLNPELEIKEYFDKQPENWKKEIAELDDQINAPMEKDCRVAVCIPIAGHAEGKNIFETLGWYKNQKDTNEKPLNNKLFEILAFVNHPKDAKPDKTIEEIKRFQKENPDMKIRLVYKVLDKKDAIMGNIRKYISDLALLRQSKREPGAKDLILVSNDADCKGIKDKYIANFIDMFDKNPKADGVLGKIEWEPSAYIKSPLVHIGTRFMQYLDVISRHHKEKSKFGIASSGANFAYKGSIYAGIGGYDNYQNAGEDKNLGSMIKYSRRGANIYPILYGGGNSMIVTNARRSINAMERGLSPAEQWDSFGPDDELRKMAWEIKDEENIKDVLDKKDYQEKLKTTLQGYVNRTLKLYQLDADSYEARRALSFIGVKYTIEKGKIVFTDISKLINDLKAYQEKGPFEINRVIKAKVQENVKNARTHHRPVRRQRV